MRYTDEELAHHYCKHDGLCHLCWGEIRFNAYGKPTGDGWQVDHIVPRAHGGSDHPRNLAAAHSVCNNYKGTRPASVVRRELAELNEAREFERAEERRRERNRMLGAGALGAGFGALIDKEKPARGAFFGFLIAAALAS